MKRRLNLSATGEDEFLERSQVLLASIDHALEFGRILRFDCRHILERLTWRSGKQAANIEEFVLDPPKILLELFGRLDGSGRFLVQCSHQANRGIQFIYGAVRFDTEAVFRDLLSSGKTR